MKKKILSVILASVMCLTSLFTVEAMTGSPVVSVTAEAASDKTGTYKVTHSNGVNVRKKASTSSTVVGASAKGTTFKVKEIKTAGGYTWGYTDSIKCTNGKKSGWVALKYCTYQAPKPEPAKPAEISFKGVSFPSSITKGKGQHLAGTISSTQNITKIKAVVDNYTTGNTVMEYTVNPNSKSYALYDSTLDWSLSFGKLSEGDYRLVYHVWSGSTTHSMNMFFSVKAEAPAVPDTSYTEDTSDKEGAFLDLEASRKYAAKYWDRRDNNYSGWNKDYWKGYGSNDCANFVSQILVAGGLPTDDEWDKGEDAFIKFDKLKRYLYENYNIKTIMRKKYSACTQNDIVTIKSNLSIKDISAGDLIINQGYANGTFTDDGHIMFVNYVRGNCAYVYAHTNDRGGDWPVGIDGIQGVIKTSELYK